jgi:hypothetical protein
MNERILKLVTEARQYAWDNEIHWSANAEREALFEKKFAELIVLECIKLFPQANFYGGGAIQGTIKEHFGVKEC